ncbi:AMP-binding protein [Lentzea sp. NEAU-D13]|uniref:AMP-binding protein n=1 Tax=Lentzea alba TaxID=2714351 RepID=A0A7C9W4P0_9PSEU|nr:AMP-binding protein [Lentzea alba]NGY65838.1 AMP-binding protein [Lentzea alba]
MTYVDLVLERLAADPDREAVIGGDTRLTRAQARDLLFRLADGLVRRGIKPGDGVAVYVGNTPEAVLLNLAVHLLGGRLVYVPPEPGTAELKALVERAEVAAVVVDPSFGTQIDGWHLQDLPGDLVERAPAREFATVYYTGGTTGLPKLAVHRSDDLWETRASLPPTNLLSNTLITHGSGAGAVQTALLTGSKLVLGPSTFDADTFVRLARDEQITMTVFVPPMMYEVLDHPDCPGPQFHVIVGGSPLAPKRLRQAIEKWGPVVNQGYGMTEAHAITLMRSAEVDLSRPDTLRTVGKANPLMEVETRDGDVWVRGPFVMEGYWGEPPLKETSDGWFNTGDMGYFDDDGYLYLNDRSKDVIVTGRTSDNVYSRLLDDFLITLPGIRQAAAVARPDEALGEVVHVFLVTDGQEVDIDRLRDSVVAELGELYQPRGVTIVPELPLTKVGKVDKRKLRSHFR